MKRIYLDLALSIDEDVDPEDIVSFLFNYLVNADDLPPVIVSIDGVEVRRS